MIRNRRGCKNKKIGLELMWLGKFRTTRKPPLSTHNPTVICMKIYSSTQVPVHVVVLLVLSTLQFVPLQFRRNCDTCPFQSFNCSAICVLILIVVSN